MRRSRLRDLCGTMMMENAVRVLIFKQEDLYVAQCLEHDIAVQADDITTLKKRFETAMCCEGDDLANIEPAPQSFFDSWDAACTLGSEIPGTQMRLAA
jgi:hypothetical protein